MALYKPSPPDSVIAALRASNRVPDAPTDEETTNTHAVFEIPANLLPGSDPDHDAVSVGWRHVGNTRSGVVAARVREGSSGQMQVQEVSHGESASNTIEAIANAEQHPETQSGDYEVRILTSEGLNLRLLWLKHRAGGIDRFVPIPPAPRGLAAGQFYTWQEVQERLNPATLAPLAAAQTAPMRVGNSKPTPVASSLPRASQPSQETPTPVPTATPGASRTDDVKNLAAVITAVLAILILGISVLIVLAKLPAISTEDGWMKYVYLLGIPQAIAFAGAGWLWGREVHREQAVQAEARANAAEAEGAAAKTDARVNRQKLDDLVNVIEEHANPGREADDVGGAVLPSSSPDFKALRSIAQRIRQS